ncbi:hypothetical protein [Methylobacterium sp. CM6247]
MDHHNGPLEFCRNLNLNLNQYRHRLSETVQHRLIHDAWKSGLQRVGRSDDRRA